MQREYAVQFVEQNKNDVLKGRGVVINDYPGNLQYRFIVNHYKTSCVHSEKHVKAQIARHIYQKIQRMDPPGRFLDQDRLTKRWYVISERDALHKIRIALRDGGVPEIRERGMISQLFDASCLDLDNDQDDQDDNVSGDRSGGVSSEDSLSLTDCSFGSAAPTSDSAPSDSS